MEDPLHTAIQALERAIQSREVELERMRNSLAQLRGSAPDYTAAPKTTEWEGMGITEAAQKWLVEVGEARGTREIADAIRDRGVRTLSRNYTATVYATLANAKSKFVRRDGLWSLKSVRK
jgi:hypothetical protein